MKKKLQTTFDLVMQAPPLKKCIKNVSGKKAQPHKYCRNSCTYTEILIIISSFNLIFLRNSLDFSVTQALTFQSSCEVTNLMPTKCINYVSQPFSLNANLQFLHQLPHFNSRLESEDFSLVDWLSWTSRAMLSFRSRRLLRAAEEVEESQPKTTKRPSISSSVSLSASVTEEAQQVHSLSILVFNPESN